MKKCPACKLEKPEEEFYRRRTDNHKKGNCTPYCIPCTKTQSLNRIKKLKQQCIDYKGGQCSLCGYNKCVGALEFHHLDPSEKDFEISKNLRKNGFEKIKLELDKCILVCANCHREEHYRLNKLTPPKSEGLT